ncbi:MAG: hypothetical protein FD153_1112 [Rhodospirillaceae bacterium]|nr:MAG: hypothetical protein FD153_1112 [Rhodospirillaceae bacterium]
MAAGPLYQAWSGHAFYASAVLAAMGGGWPSFSTIAGRVAVWGDDLLLRAQKYSRKDRLTRHLGHF